MNNAKICDDHTKMTACCVILDGELDPDTLSAIAKAVQGRSSNAKIEVLIGKASSEGPCHAYFVTGPDLILAAAVGAIVSAFVNLFNLAKAQKAQRYWDSERAFTVIRDEMFANGVVDYGIDSIQGFDALNVNSEEPCVVVVTNRTTRETYRLYLFGNGDKFSVRITAQ